MKNETTVYVKYEKEEQLEWGRQTQFYLILNPYCKACLRKNKVVPAEKVVHIKILCTTTIFSGIKKTGRAYVYIISIK